MILFIMASIGLTNLLVYGKILNRPRAWLKSRISTKASMVLDCYQCVGFWAGMICGLSLTYNPFHLLLTGFAGSWLSEYVNVVREYLEEKRKIVPFRPDSGRIDPPAQGVSGRMPEDETAL